jgi:hypothetical protein
MLMLAKARKRKHTILKVRIIGLSLVLEIKKDTKNYLEVAVERVMSFEL